MKKTTILKLVTGLCAVLTLMNCGGGGGDSTDSEKVTPTLSVSPSTVTLDGNGKGTLMVTSNTQWTVTCIDPWLSYTPNSGSGSAQVTLSAPVNSGRSTILTFTDKSNKVTTAVSVIQKAPVLTVNPSSINFASAGGSNSFSVESNISWTVSSSDSWCTVSPSYGSGNGNVTVNVAANPDPAARQTTITISGATLSSSITITQDPNIEDPSIGRDDFGDDDNLNNK